MVPVEIREARNLISTPIREIARHGGGAHDDVGVACSISPRAASRRSMVLTELRDRLAAPARSSWVIPGFVGIGQAPRAEAQQHRRVAPSAVRDQKIGRDIESDIAVKERRQKAYVATRSGR